MSDYVMSKSNSCDNQQYFVDLTSRISDVLTEKQWLILERRFIYNDTPEAIGRLLGIASVGVIHSYSKAIEDIFKSFNKEVDCFSMRLEKLLSDAGRILTVEECFTAFPEINECEFNILFEVCQKNREGIFHREKEMISIGEKI